MSRVGRARPCFAAALLPCIVAAPGCAYFNGQMDHWGMERKARLVAKWPDQGRPASLPFSSAAELEELTRPGDPPPTSIVPLGRHRVEAPGVVQEDLSFDSAVRLRHPESDRARAYVYRRGPLGERPVVLWVAGQSTGDGDMEGIAEYMRDALGCDADVVFYVPPYHLERTPAGYASGDAFLATDFADHLAFFAQGLSDLRVLAAWARGLGAPAVGGVGTSMGGWFLAELATMEKLDFLTLMIPVVRWDAMLASPEMAPVRRRMAAQDMSEAEVTLAYRALNPVEARPLVDPARVTILYGRYDRIAREAQIHELARAWGVERLVSYPRGHALMPVNNDALHRDLAASLRRDLAAIRGLSELRAEERPALPRTPGSRAAQPPAVR